MRRTATTLLDTYVGRHAGERILQGQIRRGDIERIEAVIMLTDLRDFTILSDQLPGDQVIDLLNSHFDCLVPPIERHGGEVLKFIGDSLLAIFAVAGDPGFACEAALDAAHEGRSDMAAANAQRQQAGGPVLRYGMALHLGDVLYGNVGSADRLDFTTIGPAVNLTARLETLARDLGRDLVVSARFAAHCPEPADLDRQFPGARLSRAPGDLRAALRIGTSVAHQMHRDAPLVRAGAVLEQVDALPAAEIRPAGVDRDREMGRGQGGADVRRHVVRAFLGVPVVAQVLRHDAPEELVEIVQHVRIGVLLDQERCRGVVQVEGQQALRDAWSATQALTRG